MNEPVSDSAASVKRYYWTPRAMHVLLRDEQAPGLHVTFITESDYAAAIAERDALQKQLDSVTASSIVSAAIVSTGLDRQGDKIDEIKTAVVKLIAERDAAQRECERLRIESVKAGAALAKGTLRTAELERDLARANESIRKMGETCDQEIERLKSCISAQSWMCAKYHEAVALLRRWVVHSCDWETESDRDESEALFERDTPAFLATIDAEEAKR